MACGRVMPFCCILAVIWLSMISRVTAMPVPPFSEQSCLGNEGI
jgi:hypothetical protein